MARNVQYHPWIRSIRQLSVIVLIAAAVALILLFYHIALAAAAFAGLIFKLDILWVVLAGTAISILVF